MGSMFKLAAILFLVGGIAAGSLAFFNSFTKPAIEKLKLESETKAREYVLSGLVPEENIKNVIYEKDSVQVNGSYEFFDKVKENENASEYKAYIFIAKGSGFSGVIETMVCTDIEFNINRMKVLKHTETPGLGAEAQTIKYGAKEPFFETWFKGKNSLKVVVEKDDSTSKDKIQSLTGATITTRAICKSIVSYSEILKTRIDEQDKIYIGNAEDVIEVDIEKLIAQAKQDSLNNAKQQVAAGGR